MRRAIASLALPWALWAHLETTAVPATIPPLRASHIVERFEHYTGCDLAARWAEAQPDLREDWTVDEQGAHWYSTIRYECRIGP